MTRSPEMECCSEERFFSPLFELKNLRATSSFDISLGENGENCARYCDSEVKKMRKNCYFLLLHVDKNAEELLEKVSLPL